MFIAPPPFNYWQCLVTDRQQNVLQGQSSIESIAYLQVKNLCLNDALCNPYGPAPYGIHCSFNGVAPIPTCTVADEAGVQFTAQASYQPCSRAVINCVQAHRATLRYNFHCQVVAQTG